MLKTLYKSLPLGKKLRWWLTRRVPTYLKRDPHLRSWGSVAELYYWSREASISTVAPIQNFYSFLFPVADTATHGNLWIFDSQGNELRHVSFNIDHFGLVPIDIGVYAPEAVQHGTFMWNIVPPPFVSGNHRLKNSNTYFVDRGYISYEHRPNQSTGGAQSQAAFVHGVDRFAVFQRGEECYSDYFYRSTGSYEWTPEAPIHCDLYLSLDVVVINRTAREATIVLKMLDGNSVEQAQIKELVCPRGCVVFKLTTSILRRYYKDFGSIKLCNLPTKWGRPLIFARSNDEHYTVMHS